MLHKLIIGAVALASVACAIPAQARDHHRHHHSRRVVVYERPYYYDRPVVVYDRPYYRPYYSDYYEPAYYGGPSFTFAFGGHRHRHWR